MKRCAVCLSYTFNEDKCSKCGGELMDPSPPKFALQDPHYSIKLEAYLRSPKLRG